jgi:hypothetical protein
MRRFRHSLPAGPGDQLQPDGSSHRVDPLSRCRHGTSAAAARLHLNQRIQTRSAVWRAVRQPRTVGGRCLMEGRHFDQRSLGDDLARRERFDTPILEWTRTGRGHDRTTGPPSVPSMLRCIAFVLCGGVALTLISCSDDTPSESESSGSTPATTLPVASSPAASSTSIGGATTLPASSAPVVDATDSVPAGATTIPGRTVADPSDNVVLGDTGPGVEEIQTALRAHGFKVVVDGDFGPQTDEAVRAFQKQSGIKQDGIVGAITWSKLQAPPSATTTSVSVSEGTAATT